MNPDRLDPMDDPEYRDLYLSGNLQYPGSMQRAVLAAKGRLRQMYLAAGVTPPGEGKEGDTIASLRDENAKLRAERDALREEQKRDWTATLCDRLNEFAREHQLPQCADGPTAAELVRCLHGYAGGLRGAVADAEVALDYMNHYSWDFRYQAKGAAALERFRNRNKEAT